MSFDSLSLEIIIEIASASPAAWLALSVAYPPFGSYTLTDAGRADAFRAFGRLEITQIGTKRWYLNGRLHRDGEPAIECSSGTTEWYHRGQRHRDGGPAIENSDGSKWWFQHGELIRMEYP